MSYEAVTDTLVSELLALGQAAANADVTEILPDLAIVKTFNFPNDLKAMSALPLPALTVYRRRTRSNVQTTMQHRDDQLVTFHCGYLLPSTSPVDAAARWPLLDRVWRSLVSAWDDGFHASYSGGAEVLRAAGVISDVGSAQKDEQWIGGDRGQVFPGFVGSFQLLVRPATDPTAGLDDASLRAKYHIDRIAADTAEDGDVEDDMPNA